MALGKLGVLAWLAKAVGRLCRRPRSGLTPVVRAAAVTGARLELPGNNPSIPRAHALAREPAGPPNASGHCAATASPQRRSAGRSSDDAGPDYVSPPCLQPGGIPVPGYLPGSPPAVSTSVRPLCRR